jgi:hypothetical protein
MSQIPDVAASARYVVERARWVRVDEDAARTWAGAQRIEELEAPFLPPELRFRGDRGPSANLTLLLSSLNFCFWSEEPWSVEFRGKTWTRTYAMYASVLRGIEEDASWLTARRWAAADRRTVAHLFRGKGRIPFLENRQRVLAETGRRLMDRFEGRFANAVEEAGGDARGLAYLLADEFPSFRDTARYGGREIALLKRAQICAADLHHTWRSHGHAGLNGMDKLTVFADYRLPQFLRHVGIVRLEEEFARRIERRERIPAGSPEEVELRCATIVAGEVLREAFGGRVPAWHLDFVLWSRSHEAAVKIEHHRTRTFYY